MLVKAWVRDGYWIGEPCRMDGSPITSIEELAGYVDWNSYVLLRIWPAGKAQRCEEPRLVNLGYVESWEECGFADVINCLPDRNPPARRRHQRRTHQQNNRRRKRQSIPKE